MESNIKGLVAAGHEMASELKAECGAVDMRSVAKLISDLATQLEVQLVRANALAAENAALKESERAFDAMCAEEHGDNWVSELTETPATDAFLAEVRAQGVEMFAECAYTLEHHDHAVAFAAELRKGGNQ
ncbi:hypothetical protein HmCmsJML116_00954 [Escherichia coli]|uniref:hypothetical protein n=1 Tax=Escherichia coli TaxID=562 RepID=UPI0010CC2AD8|nr:hypothetical protein [Escherichia coli]GCW39685.1 hypothetical protein HmCmsJML116_00954 [Escherichia coli]GCZ56823.1 hypothetical protein HmCmsJML136_02054 [Escherichia coli]GDB29379.1 hypothetical protein HmCmsJML188_00365 [Escherichia coli]